MKQSKLMLSAWSACLVLLLGFGACSSNDNLKDEKREANVVDGSEKSYTIDRCKILSFLPNFSGMNSGSFTWYMSNKTLNIKDSIVSRSRDLNFVALEEGKYELTCLATSNGQKKTLNTIVDVKKEKVLYSAYISKVFDYLPAVGQFVNELPKYEEGDTHADMIAKAEKSIAGEDGIMIHLGGFGGYVEFGFDHTIVNVPGKRDIRILGNAFWADANPNAGASKRGGSCEPGVIMVAYDKNKNGKPDEDEWYEIAGSEHNNPNAIKNYEITFFRPDENKTPVRDPKFSWASDMEYIYWKDNQGNEGYKPKNTFHKQPYFPSWVKEDKITFKGTLLPNNAVDESGTGQYWVLYSFEYGYVDNAPNDDDESAIDINWAVDKQGNKVHLPGIDFVRVYNGLNQEAGWLGETSTEVAGAYDLHLLEESIKTRTN